MIKHLSSAKVPKIRNSFYFKFHRLNLINIDDKSGGSFLVRKQIT